MKFLCVPCDHVMAFAERHIPGDGTLAVVFGCPKCGREMALLANPYETQLVSSLGVKVGGRAVPEQPMELMRGNLEGGRPDAFTESTPQAPGDAPIHSRGPVWSPDALERLERVPSFVRGMVKRIYVDWASERGISKFTPEVMDQARSELGLEGM